MQIFVARLRIAIDSSQKTIWYKKEEIFYKSGLTDAYCAQNAAFSSK